MERRIEQREVLRYLGYAGQSLDDELLGRIGGIIAQCEAELVPKVVTAWFPVEAKVADTLPATDGDGAVGYPSVDLPEENGPAAPVVRGVSVVGTPLELEGVDISRHLEGACGCVLMACTLGAKSEQVLTRLKLTNPLDALVYDAACSAYVEAAADEEEARIIAEAADKGLYTNFRYSPGYGDLPLSIQPLLLAVLQSYGRIGISVSESGLLIPTKSITAVIGLFDAPPDRPGPESCTTCSERETCAIRASGKVCHG